MRHRRSTTELPEGVESTVGGLHPYFIAPDWANETTVLVQRFREDTAYLLTMELAN